MTAVTRRTALRTAAAGAALAAAPSAAEARGRPAADDDLGLLFDGTRCVGCRACTVKCREANGRAPDVKVVDGVAYDAPLDLGPQTLTVIKRWTEGDREGFVKAQCMHCADPACVSVCMLGALHKEPRGVVGYDVSRCVGCRYCQVACPFNVPRFEWSSATPRITKCELCRHRYAEGKGAACAEACPRDAVRFGRRADLLAEARRRLAAAPEAYYQKIYGERDGGGTGVLVLSAVPFETLGLPLLGKEPVPALGERIQHGIYQGFVAPVALFGALAFVTWRNRGTSHVEEER
ncbi:hydrogenase 2 operon protein HybA [Anaeromyxobacter oryzae]|uniref:Hydrogenase n=1 Tax=Anaeromyxobacter oryzae TaxID=2918170 RepID=A0ABM7WUK8_9BACT|nr:hydrogenase 2 operon protein HybA [Anaeromyxobacter oryzae]BDG03180.1 hydrogenase [Anaeromyxobacter oryzae]